MKMKIQTVKFVNVSEIFNDRDSMIEFTEHSAFSWGSNEVTLVRVSDLQKEVNNLELSGKDAINARLKDVPKGVLIRLGV